MTSYVTLHVHNAHTGSVDVFTVEGSLSIVTCTTPGSVSLGTPQHPGAFSLASTARTPTAPRVRRFTLHSNRLLLSVIDAQLTA